MDLICSARLYEDDGRYKQLLPYRDVLFFPNADLNGIATVSEYELTNLPTKLKQGTIKDFVALYGDAFSGKYVVSARALPYGGRAGVFSPFIVAIVKSNTRIAVVSFNFGGAGRYHKVTYYPLGPSSAEFHPEVGKTTFSEIQALYREGEIPDKTSQNKFREAYYTSDGKVIRIDFIYDEERNDFIVSYYSISYI